MNYLILIIIVIVALFVFLIYKNQNDKKKFEQEIIDAETPPEKDDSENL